MIVFVASPLGVCCPTTAILGRTETRTLSVQNRSKSSVVTKSSAKNICQLSNPLQVIYATAFPQLDVLMLERLLEGEEYRLLVLWEKNMRGGTSLAVGWRSFHDVYCNYSLITGCGAESQNIKAAFFLFFFCFYINHANRLLPVSPPPHPAPEAAVALQKAELMGLKPQRIEEGDTRGTKLRGLWGWGRGCSWPHILSLLSKPPFFNNSFLYPASK